MFCCCELLDSELFCPICGRVNLDYNDDYEPEDETEDESKLCPLCRMDAKEIFNTEMARKLLRERRGIR